MLSKAGGGGKGPSFLIDGSLQGWFAQEGAVELQASTATIYLNLHSSNDHHSNYAYYAWPGLQGIHAHCTLAD